MNIKKFFAHIFGIPDVDELQGELQGQLQGPNQQNELTDPELTDEELADLTDGVPPVASLHIILLNDGTLQIMADWSEQTEPMGNIYGKFLHHILSGDIEDNILQHFAAYAQSDIIKQNFIETITTSLKKYRDKEEEPLIPPTSALKIDVMKREEE